MFNQGALSRDRPAYAIDLFGHGQSDKNVDDGSIAVLARQIVDFIEAQSLQDVHLVGHSLGAAVGIAAAALVPEHVKSITSICGAGLGASFDHRFVEAFVAAQKRKEIKTVLERLFADPGLVSREMLENVIGYRRLDGVQDALSALAGIALGERSLADISDIHARLPMPRLAIFAEQDSIVPPPARAEIVAGAGHMPHLERSDPVNGRLATFLSEHD